MAQSRMALITFFEGGDPVDPGFGVSGPPVYPSHGLPGGGYPSHGLPGSPGHPGNALPPPGQIVTLPVFPFDPTIDNTLPGSGGSPDNTLPVPPATTKPIVPGARFIVKFLACYGLVLVPDNTLPETPEPK